MYMTIVHCPFICLQLNTHVHFCCFSLSAHAYLRMYTRTYVVGTCSASGVLFVAILVILLVAVIILKFKNRRHDTFDHAKGTYVIYRH